MISDSSIFPYKNKFKIIIFGNSKVLSGFIPKYFDKLTSSNDQVVSYNIGLPGCQHFVHELEILLEKKEIPTHVFITLPWERWEKRTRKDSELMNYLFPFRTLPRDIILFALRSTTRGGLKRYYDFAKQSERLMLENRGYYFIEGQSHFPNDILPSDFELASDNPNFQKKRNFSTDGDVFKKLSRFAKEYGIMFFIVPTYYRCGEYAPIFENENNNTLVKNNPSYQILGPEYYLFENKYFSDQTHLNYQGAKLYTENLASLFSRSITP
ncbi:MAG: hypothetical protein WC123_03480 [Bacilli bacterium]